MVISLVYGSGAEEVDHPREESRLLQPWWFDRREERER
jgi:hypothetical protein